MYYEFHQNNSGGSFEIIKSRGIGHIVMIEAESMDSALAIAEDIGLYFDGVNDGIDCECCGDRWSGPGSMEGTNEPVPTYGHSNHEEHYTYVHPLNNNFYRML